MSFDLAENLKAAIAVELQNANSKALASAATELSLSYRSNINTSQTRFASDIHRAAYLVTRFPATYAATQYVFSEVKRLLPELEIKTLLDVCAGPGTASFAAIEAFEELENITVLERDAEMLALGQRLSQNAKYEALLSAQRIRENVNTSFNPLPNDLIVISYALNELNKETKTRIVKQAWEACDKLLIIIEPGTMRGFANILKARTELLAVNANLLAPCPHASSCPLAQNDWCHFSVRLMRTDLHRKMKSASLAFEDEKFSYLVFSKVPGPQAQARILRRPLKHKGHVQLSLCTHESYKTEIISARDKEAYKRARKADWGDAWES